MTRSQVGNLLLAAWALSACGQSDVSGVGEMDDFESLSEDQYLGCAIAISAYSYLIRDGILPEDRKLPKDGLISLMWHNNAYAIGRDLGEKAVADLIQEGREKLIEETDPEAIFELASRCSAVTPDT